ncbi:hypothetical protein ACFPM0_07935 [Pseudonocardia sulfidoxydans]|uniref:hypothetical protein n=1 Tax=Pseudonocardia sulfidoxydans TaxID=54011 RepID=UPI0036093FAB
MPGSRRTPASGVGTGSAGVAGALTSWYLARCGGADRAARLGGPSWFRGSSVPHFYSASMVTGRMTGGTVG